MEQNDRRPFARLYIVLPDMVGADRVMLDLSHDDVLRRAIPTLSQGIAVKTRDGCRIDSHVLDIPRAEPVRRQGGKAALR